MNKYSIVIAHTENEFAAASQLFKEYANWLNIDLCFQNFEAELLELQTMYAAPKGILLLVKTDNNFVGCVAIRQKENDIAELKRMYIQPQHRGIGLAKQLLEQALQFAKNAHYTFVRLDTLASMAPAINLYKQYGFYEIDAYYHNPESNAVYFEKKLKN
jgi:putative acetyltransferase